MRWTFIFAWLTLAVAAVQCSNNQPWYFTMALAGFFMLSAVVAEVRNTQR